MTYISTRKKAEPLSFQDTVLAGLAPDGGLFVPAEIPRVDSRLDAWKDLTFTALFEEVIAPFVGDAIPSAELSAMIARSYQRFDHPEVTPLVEVGGQHLVELFHGPTFAFKDVALQFLGNLFEYFLRQAGKRLTVVGATSGDTGSAAIHALRGKAGVEVFILYPRGRVSPVQEMQMTTVPDENIHCLAVEGSFDDAQAIVKGLFNDRAFNDQWSLGAVNSINWARVMAQTVYYFYGYFQLAKKGVISMGAPVRFSIPTGNFGHVYAGYLVRQMGLPIEKLIIATNANDILHRFVSSGEYRKGDVAQTLSPSMDIQVASNFERYLFSLSGGDGQQVRYWLEQLDQQGGFRVEGNQLAQVRADFQSARVDDAATVETIREVYGKNGYLLDPHTATGVRAAMELGGSGAPVITMATAHPAKFDEAIARAIGTPPPLPPALAGLGELPQRVTTLPATLEAVRGHIQNTLGERG